MQLIAYLLAYPILWLISILPFRLLYALSDGIYILLYYIVGYRKKTVRQNLALALPHLTDAERLKIEKKSFRHLCDMFLEMIKTMNISQKEIEKRFVFTNIDEYKAFEQKGKSIALMCAHYASYEWVISINRHTSFEGYAIYKRIRNKHFDDLVKKIRSRFKAHLITTKETVPTINECSRSGKLGIFGFASDQTPKLSSAFHWKKFMGVEVPVHTGAEMLSKRHDMNIAFLKVRKVSRGHYEARFEKFYENVQQYPDYTITDDFMEMVESQIYEAPEFYFWIHKRWKHKRN
ncbi:MAG: lysophospholipid acyltransferase family protein [Flavobacteriaceae bacterium]